MPKKPWFKFHAQDWLAEPHLRMCGPAAHGLLINLMAIAHGNSDVGYLGAVCKQNASRMLAWSPQTVSKAWAELEQNGRIMLAENGQWCIPRMVADNEYASKQAEFGAQGGSIRAQTLKGGLKGGLKAEKRREDIEKKREDIERGASPKSFKQWSEDDLKKSMAENDGILSADDAAAFFDYWSEPSAKGRLALSLKPTWDTRRRMQTWARNNEKRGNRNTGGDGFVSSLPK